MSTEHTTPLEREILAHYAVYGGPYLGGDQNWREVHHSIINTFTHLGLLYYDVVDGDPVLKGNRAALDVYMAALAAVPLPSLRWSIP